MDQGPSGVSPVAPPPREGWRGPERHDLCVLRCERGCHSTMSPPPITIAGGETIEWCIDPVRRVGYLYRRRMPWWKRWPRVIGTLLFRRVPIEVWLDRAP